jgi:hypothetical protein
MTEVKLADFEKACTELFTQKVVIETIKAKLKTENEKLRQCEGKLLTTFEEHEIEKHHVKGMGTIYVKNQTSVKIPKTLEEKTELFSHLQQRDIFFESVNVNSKWLNSYFKEEFEAAADKLNFKLPGVGEPIITTTIATRKG